MLGAFQPSSPSFPRRLRSSKSPVYSHTAGASPSWPLFPMPSEIKPLSTHPRAPHCWETTPHSSSLDAADELTNSYEALLGENIHRLVSAVLMSLASRTQRTRQPAQAAWVPSPLCTCCPSHLVLQPVPQTMKAPCPPPTGPSSWLLPAHLKQATSFLTDLPFLPALTWSHIRALTTCRTILDTFDINIQTRTQYISYPNPLAQPQGEGEWAPYR